MLYKLRTEFKFFLVLIGFFFEMIYRILILYPKYRFAVNSVTTGSLALTLELTKYIKQTYDKTAILR